MWDCVLALVKKAAKGIQYFGSLKLFCFAEILQKILGTCSKHSSDEEHIFSDSTLVILSL